MLCLYILFYFSEADSASGVFDILAQYKLDYYYYYNYTGA